MLSQRLIILLYRKLGGGVKLNRKEYPPAPRLRRDKQLI